MRITWQAIDDLTSALEQTDATTDIADKVSYRLNRGDAYMKLDMYPQAIVSAPVDICTPRLL